MSRRSGRLKSSMKQSAIIDDNRKCENQFETTSKCHKQSDDPDFSPPNEVVSKSEDDENSSKTSDEGTSRRRKRHKQNDDPDFTPSNEVVSEAENDENSSKICDEDISRRGGRRNKSLVWNYFAFITKNKVKCSICSRMIQYHSNSTSTGNLLRHLRKKHPTELSCNREQSESDTGIDSHKNISTFDAGNNNENERINKFSNVSSQSNDPIDVDINQPWMFFNIITGQAKCKLCFHVLSYKSVNDFTVLINHLQAEHSVSFRKLGTDVAASSGSLKKPKSKLETYFKHIDNDTAICKMCTYTVSYSRSNNKPLVSHLYWKHKNFFSKRYPSFWHFSKSFNGIHMNDKNRTVSQRKINDIRDCNSGKRNSVERDQTSNYLDDNNFDVSIESDDGSCASNNTASDNIVQELDHTTTTSTEDNIVQETVMTASTKFLERYPNHSRNILSCFLKFGEKEAKCKFCSKRILFKGDLNVLEQHICNQHRINFTKKILNVLIFSGNEAGESIGRITKKSNNKSNIKPQSTESMIISQSIRNEHLKDTIEKIWSYFEKLEDLKFNCKICSKSFLLENDDDTKELSVHVWYAHVQTIFKSVLSIQSFDKPEESLPILEKYNRWNKNEANALRKMKLNSSVEWTKAVGKVSRVWRYFLVPRVGKPFAKCRICHRILSIQVGNVSNLSRHIRLKHPDTYSKNWNRTYRRKRMFCRNTKKEILQKYSSREVDKSISCKICSRHFSDYKSLSEHSHLEHMDSKNEMNIFEKPCIKNRDTVQIVPLKKVPQYVKCKLCGEYLLYSNEAIMENHLIGKHKDAYETGLTHNEYTKNLKRILAVDDHMNVTIKSSEKKYQNDTLSSKDMCSYFLKSGANYSKCKICQKFISKKVHCRHKVPLIFSLAFGVGTMSVNKSSSLRSIEGNGSTTSRISMNVPGIYCCSISIMKSYCDLCLRQPNPYDSGFICRCITNRKLVNVINENSNANENLALGTQYLQDLPKFENKGYSVMFSMNYFRKSCCLLCSDEISVYKSYLLACFEHLISKHKSLLINVHKSSKNYFDQRMLDYEGSLDAVLSSVNNCEKTSSNPKKIPKELKSFCKKPLKKSRLWKLFSHIGGNKVMCNTCRLVLSFGMSNMRRHLKLKHPSLDNFIELGKKQKPGTSEESSAGKKQKPATSGESSTQKSEKTDRLKSNVWKYFKRRDDYWAECNKCKRFISLKGGSTHNLARHLKSKSCYDEQLDTNFWSEKVGSPEGTQKSKKKKSNIWSYFEKSPPGKMKCSICKRLFSYSGGSSSNLSRHLRLVHKIWIVSLPTHVDGHVLSIQNMDNEIAQSDLVNLTNEIGLEKNFNSSTDDNINVIQVPSQSSECMSTMTNSIEDQYSGEKVIVEGIYQHCIPDETFEGGSQLQGVSDDVLNSNENVTYILSNCIESVEESSVQANTISDAKILDSSSNLTVVQENDSPVPLKLDSLLKKDRKSWIWQYFYKLNDELVKCLICQIALSFKSRTIHNLSRHLAKKHSLYDDKKLAQKSPYIIHMKDYTERKPPQRNRHKERTSVVWNYFSRLDDRKAKCKICNAVITSNFFRHLELKHNFQKRSSTMSEATASS